MQVIGENTTRGLLHGLSTMELLEQQPSPSNLLQAEKPEDADDLVCSIIHTESRSGSYDSRRLQKPNRNRRYIYQSLGLAKHGIQGDF